MSSSELAAAPQNLSANSTEIRSVNTLDEDTSPWLLALLLTVITLAAYWPTFANQFINYDDPGYVYNNSHLQGGLRWTNVVWAARATYMANWHPLTWMSHMADVQLFGLNPADHHAASLLLHIINAILLFYLLRAATGFLWRSFAVAALFALHPLNVECVAWVSERKSLLCTLFLFLTLFAYGWYARRPNAGRYGLVAVLFALGLAAKPMNVTLPFTLLLVDYWPLRRLPERSENNAAFLKRLGVLALEKAPLLLISAASGWITVIAQGRANAIAANQLLPLPLRTGNAVWSYALYLWKTIWPVNLVIFYPHPEARLGYTRPLLAALALVVVTWACVRWKERGYLASGWLWYLGTLVPVIGIVQVGRQAMADRYVYTPLIGIFVMAVWWLADEGERRKWSAGAVAGITACLLLYFGVFTWRQTTYWKNSFTLFEHAIEVTKENFIAENNLGEAYMQQGRPEDAYPHFLKATQFKPRFGLGHYNLGIVLVGQHKNDEALREFELAIRYGQDQTEIASAYHNLGIVLLQRKQFDDAIHSFSEALQLVPTKQSSLLARGMAEFESNRFAAAEQDFVAGANLAPDPPAAFWVGRAREAQGKIDGAIEAYRRALQLQPDMPEAKERLNTLLTGRAMPFLAPGN